MNSISKSLIFITQSQIHGKPNQNPLDDDVHCRYG
jgi:hypothetical protein